MIRVLHFADIVNRNDFIHTVLEFCDVSEFRMSAATLVNRGTLNHDPSGIAVSNLNAPGSLTFPWAVLALRRLLERERIDILHAHHFFPGLIATAAVARTRAVLVIGRHYSDAVYRLSHGVRRRAYLWLEMLCNRAAARIVVPAWGVERVLLAQGVSGAKIVRIPYGFAFERYQPPADITGALSLWGQDPGLRLATFARLHPEKGHHHLVEALALLTQKGLRVTWLVAGDGPARSALEKLVREKGLAERVVFAGWRTDVVGLMKAAQVIVQPTLHEAFSQVMVEAMAAERPLVISDVSGVRDVVRHAETGWIVPPGDPPALAAAIEHLRDERVAGTMAARARVDVRQRFDARTIAPRFEALYRQLAGALA
jgi:glycosyltransferase involved in cell wall biosynthesis